MTKENASSILQAPANVGVFAYFDLAYDSRIWVSAINGDLVPVGTKLVASKSGFSTELSSSHEISISGTSLQDKNLELVRILALGFEPYELATHVDVSRFEGFLEIPECHGQEVSQKVVVQIEVENLYELPRFQVGILDSSRDAISGQPFFQPLSREQLMLAADTKLGVGDRILVEVRGQPMCLSLKSQIGETAFEAVLYGNIGMPSLEGERIRIAVQISCGQSRTMISSQIGQVLKCFDQSSTSKE